MANEFYGFSPQNHVGETPTVTAPKYAVYNYLQGVDPKTAWAQSAADALNQQFNTQQFKALDQETLGYGDEYVHSGRPGGPGATGSLSNPAGTGAFTWGSTPAAGPAGTGPGGMTADQLQRLLMGLMGSSQSQPSPFGQRIDTNPAPPQAGSQIQLPTQTGMTTMNPRIDPNTMVDAALSRLLGGG